MQFVYLDYFSSNNNKSSRIWLFNEEQTSYADILLLYSLVVMASKLFKLNVAN